LNFETISQLQKQGMVRGIPTFKTEIARCETCIYLKHNQEIFPTGSWRTNRCLQLIHGDVCGPLEASLGGCKYFFLFIDDFSQMNWVSFLKEK
jgi:hypothetical protein